MSTLSIFTLNIGNPSKERAIKQVNYLQQRPEDVLILTETKSSDGCKLLEQYFRLCGYDVFFPMPEKGEYGAMIVSKHKLFPSTFSDSIKFLNSRVVSAKLNFCGNEIELIGTYVPSRDSSIEKIIRKKKFLNNLMDVMNCNDKKNIIFSGDLNILEPDHIPHYPFFESWEYDFYTDLTKCGFVDVFNYLNSNQHEYSWVGRFNDGYRYDYTFVTQDLVTTLHNCNYVHETRTLKNFDKRLTDHSAISVGLKF